MNMKSKLVTLLACAGLITSVGAYAANGADGANVGSVTATFSVSPSTGYQVNWLANGNSVTSSEAYTKGVGSITIVAPEGSKSSLGSSDNINLTDQTGTPGALTFGDGKGGAIVMTAAGKYIDAGPLINGTQAVNTTVGDINSPGTAFNIKSVAADAKIPAGTYSDVITVKLWN